REMVDMGINIATAQDTICDGFHLYGTGDPLDYGLIGAYTGQYNTPDTARLMFDMLTTRSMKIFDPDASYGIEVGNDADLNIIDADNVQEALRTRASRPYVIRHGKVIASFERKATLY
ncbi:MAG TPA: cytosine deaminase, partial [Candidatus Aphodomorpha intestinavium]|nr:cytosine deaminase [Candidatus Aphodomorpha intestinavium]